MISSWEALFPISLCLISMIFGFIVIKLLINLNQFDDVQIFEDGSEAERRGEERIDGATVDRQGRVV